MWTLVRFLHVVAVAFFVGGQLMLALAVVPALRGHADDAAMLGVARRFGIGSVVAAVTLLATGVAMASHLSLWGDGVLQAKLALVALVGVLIGLHVVLPYRRALSIALLLVSLAVVWLGVELSH